MSWLEQIRSCYVMTYITAFGGVEGGPFWVHVETRTFMGATAFENTALYPVGVNKIPPDLDTLFVMSL